MRKGIVKYQDIIAGIIYEDAEGIHFDYDETYRNAGLYPAISKTFPLKVSRYSSNTLFPFFDGLIPEGWLLDIAEDNWKLDRRDRMGLLLKCCKDCIGAISVHPDNDVSDE